MSEPIPYVEIATAMVRFSDGREFHATFKPLDGSPVKASIALRTEHDEKETTAFGDRFWRTYESSYVAADISITGGEAEVTKVDHD